MKHKLISIFFKAQPILLTVFLWTTVVSVSEGQRRWFRSPDYTDEPKEEIVTTHDTEGYPIRVLFTRGCEHNHPLMAVWIEDLDSNYIQTIYIAESIGRGVFRHGDPSTGMWKPGAVRRPAALPYWGHQRGVQADDGYYIPTQDDPVPDGITGPTPRKSFVIHSQTPGRERRQFRVLFEINQSWDWNEYWTNNKFPGDEHYMTSSQPALVYEAFIDLDGEQDEFELVPVGHSHWSGQNGNLYTDLSTITTALDITESIKVVIDRD